MSVVLDPSPEQEQILASVRKVLAERFPVDRLRGAHASSPDDERLRWLVELGVPGLGSAEALGGSGLGLVEDMLVAVELGRHLLTPRLAACAIGARLAGELGRTELAQRLVAGEASIGLANALAPFSFDRLAGTTVHLLDVAPGGWAILWNEEGIGLLQCAGLQRQRVTATDRSIVLHRATLGAAQLAGHLPARDTSLAQQLHLLLSAQLLGMAEACRDMAVEYAKIRTQFGRPIGSFQAIKHRCADMAIRAEVLRAQVVLAALALQDGWPDAAFQVDACRMLAASHALANARAAIQIHGGMGFTAECNAHLYLLRAHLYEHLGAASPGLQQRLLDQRFLERPGDTPCA